MKTKTEEVDEIQQTWNGS